MLVVLNKTKFFISSLIYVKNLSFLVMDDNCRYFNCIEVCRVRECWNEVRLTGTLPSLSHTEDSSYILLNIFEPTEVELSLFQEGER